MTFLHGLGIGFLLGVAVCVVSYFLLRKKIVAEVQTLGHKMSEVGKS